MRPVVVSTTTTLVSAPKDVWPYITDTDRMNRLLSSAVTYKPVEAGAKTSARFLVETKTGGFSMEYEEAPFEWTVGERFSVYRRMRSGPLQSYTYSTTLEPTVDGGTKVGVRIELVPRHWLLRPIAQLQAARFLSSVGRLADAIDAHLSANAPSPYDEPTSPANDERIAYAATELAKRPLDRAVIDAVMTFVRTAPDSDLVRIRPFEIADRLGLDPRETLRVLLHAVTVGVVELRWALVCPSCRTANDQVSSLSAVGDESHCQLCDITYGIELDRAVEATFRPHPSVRQVPDKMFCIGGPWRTPHVLVQANVDEGATRSIGVPAEEARLRLFARGGVVASLEVAAGAPEEASVKLGPKGFEPAELRVAPRGTITLENAAGEPIHVKIERLGYATLAATAHLVTTMSEFRRLFSKELLKASTPLRVGHSAILFSDLTGSTALYTHAGDAAAFRFVDDHFDVLRKAIGDAGGTVVKTMGDAVMAAFVDAGACTRAAVECLRAFEVYRGTQENGNLTGLKVGLYAGPCYVITANDAIDYFGQTVNCASRVQHLAESGELILEARVFDALTDDEKRGLDVKERFEARVKGVDEPLSLVRTGLSPKAVAAA
jgi:adenylate cyclase